MERGERYIYIEKNKALEWESEGDSTKIATFYFLCHQTENSQSYGELLTLDY